MECSKALKYRVVTKPERETISLAVISVLWSVFLNQTEIEPIDRLINELRARLYKRWKNFLVLLVREEICEDDFTILNTDNGNRSKVIYLTPKQLNHKSCNFHQAQNPIEFSSQSLKSHKIQLTFKTQTLKFNKNK